MKKFLLIAALSMIVTTTSFAQEEEGSVTSTGNWLVEINTGFGESSTANTGFTLISVDGTTVWGIGGEAGYFVVDDFAIKAGIGYSDLSDDGFDGTFNWKLGGKYYVASQFPIQIDLNGSSGNDFSPLWLGIQGGYAWFVADNVSIEPGLRYGIGLNEDSGDGDTNVFGVNIGFNVFFN